MLATIGPARSIFGESAVDIALATSANRHARDHIEHVGWTWSGAHRAKEHLDGYVRSDGVTTVVYQAANNHIIEISRVGTTWTYKDVTNVVGAL